MIILVISALSFSLKAEDYIETLNIVSDENVDSVQNISIVRNIIGGTVIIPIFDETCPEEIKAPFSDAYRIIEEYMLLTLIKVAAKCENNPENVGGF